MPDETNQNVKVPVNAGNNDGLQAALRLVGFLFTALLAIAAFVRTRDIAGLMAYVQANGGAIIGAVSTLISLAIAAYGVIKTRKRGAQLETAAADPRNKGVTFK